MRDRRPGPGGPWIQQDRSHSGTLVRCWYSARPCDTASQCTGENKRNGKQVCFHLCPSVWWMTTRVVFMKLCVRIWTYCNKGSMSSSLICYIWYLCVPRPHQCSGCRFPPCRQDRGHTLHPPVSPCTPHLGGRGWAHRKDGVVVLPSLRRSSCQICCMNACPHKTTENTVYARPRKNMAASWKARQQTTVTVCWSTFHDWYIITFIWRHEHGDRLFYVSRTDDGQLTAGFTLHHCVLQEHNLFYLQHTKFMGFDLVTGKSSFIIWFGDLSVLIHNKLVRQSIIITTQWHDNMK